VNDAFGVCGIQSISDFNHQREQNIGVDGPSIDAVFQRHAIQKFHGDERTSIKIADFVDGADVWMIERGGSASLPAKAL
jgi:hypothetical protein